MTALLITYAVGMFITLLPPMILILGLRFWPEVMEDSFSFEDKAFMRKTLIDEPKWLIEYVAWSFVWPVLWVKLILRYRKKH